MSTKARRPGISRRRFLRSTAAVTVAPLVMPRLSFGAIDNALNIAVVGVGNRGWANIEGVRHENIVALCDVDARYLERAAAAFPAATTYRDYREMLDREETRIDAVVVSTPDHTHAPASALAMRLKKHVYCEKPLTHTVAESHTLAALAREHNLATQMGTQIHAGENYRRVVELVQSGAIGSVREVHVWSNKSWSNGRKQTADAPDYLDWNLWLGPAADQPYTSNVHPANWRRFWEFGTGTLGDMACHYMDLPHWALDLRAPVRVRVEGPERHTVGTPAWLMVHMEHEQRGDMPACTVHWYDGDKRPTLLKELRRADGSPIEWGDGHLFVGDKGYILSDYSRYLLLPENDFADFEPPEPWIEPSIGHYNEWIHACKTGDATTCNFDYSGALTQAVLLGNVAFRAGEVIEFDSDAIRISNNRSADELLRKEYRSGWIVEQA